MARVVEQAFGKRSGGFHYFLRPWLVRILELLFLARYCSRLPRPTAHLSRGCSWGRVAPGGASPPAAQAPLPVGRPVAPRTGGETRRQDPPCSTQVSCGLEVGPSVSHRARVFRNPDRPFHCDSVRYESARMTGSRPISRIEHRFHAGRDPAAGPARAAAPHSQQMDSRMNSVQSISGSTSFAARSEVMTRSKSARFSWPSPTTTSGRCGKPTASATTSFAWKPLSTSTVNRSAASRAR